MLNKLLHSKKYSLCSRLLMSKALGASINLLSLRHFVSIKSRNAIWI